MICGVIAYISCTKSKILPYNGLLLTVACHGASWRACPPAAAPPSSARCSGRTASSAPPGAASSPPPISGPSPLQHHGDRGVNTDIECQGCQISHLGSDRGAVVDVHLGLGVLGDGLRIWSGREEEGCVMRVVHMTVYFTSMHEFT